MRELKQASESRCPICRAILFTPTQYERDALLSDDDEPLNIVLEIDAREGTHPTLTAAFLAPAKEGATPATRVPKRMIAAFGGILDDGER
jgi:hypothetical protein